MGDSGETTGQGPSAGAGWRTVERLLRIPVRSADSRPWIALILAFGTMFRLCQYFADRQLWMDEVSLAENLREKSLAELFGPLSFMQLAPAGFLVVEGLVVRVLGFSRLALRLFPLVCGIASLGLFAGVARRCLKWHAAVVAIGLFAVSDDLIYYTSELKPYAGDVALALACTLTGLEIRSKPLMVRRCVASGAFGAVVAWFSFPCLFVLAGIGVVLLTSARARGEWAKAGRLVLAGSCWAGSYAAVDIVALNQLGHRRDLWAFWDFAFPPLPPRSAWDATWALRRFAYLFVNPLDFKTPLGPTLSALVPLWLFVVGCVSLGRRDGRCLAMLALPTGFALLAAYLRVYPFHGRLVLFLVPSLLLFVAEGAGVVREKVGRGVAWWVVLGALFFFPTLNAAYRMLEPRNRADFNPRGDRRPAWSDPERFPYPIGEGAGLGLGLIQIPEILCIRAAD